MVLNTKVFHDAVHGSIELHPLCVKFIDTPQFQRLRFIKQVGVVYFVYPAATHSRFSHCIGVSYLAGQQTRALKERQPELGITEKDVICVELAGLCHDLGHGPFSHLWEEFMKKARKDKPAWKHEQTSVEMFDYLIDVNNLKDEMKKYGLDENDRTFIKEMILMEKVDGVSQKWLLKGRSKEKGFLYQIVSNNDTGVDVDKWDYFLRDGYSLGLKVTFNYERLLKFSRVINSSENGIEVKKICYRDKELMNLYDMFHARLMLHKKAYQHRVVRTIDAMLLDAFLLANDHITYQGKDGKELPLNEVVYDLEAMTYLNDDVFHAIHRNNSPNEKMKKAKRIIHNILTRQYYPEVGRSSPTTLSIEPEQILDELCKNLLPNSELSKEDLDVHFLRFSYGNGRKNPLLRVGLFTKEEPNKCKKHNPNEVSKLLPSDFEESVCRVLCKSYDSEQIEEAKIAFVKTCHNLHIPNSQEILSNIHVKDEELKENGHMNGH